MKEVLLDLIEEIDLTCRNEGYYPDLIELNQMAEAALLTTAPIREVIDSYYDPSV